MQAALMAFKAEACRWGRSETVGREEIWQLRSLLGGCATKPGTARAVLNGKLFLRGPLGNYAANDFGGNHCGQFAIESTIGIDQLFVVKAS